MRKITENALGGTLAAAGLVAVIGGGVWLTNGVTPTATETPTSASAAPFDVASVPDVNGLAAEQEQAAAEAEATRLAAEAAAAEAARVAAEQAAAVEAQRLADEEAAAESESFEAEAPNDPPAEVDPWASKSRPVWVSANDPNDPTRGDWAGCPGSMSTGPDGLPYCD